MPAPAGYVNREGLSRLLGITPSGVTMMVKRGRLPPPEWRGQQTVWQLREIRSIVAMHRQLRRRFKHALMPVVWEAPGRSRAKRPASLGYAEPWWRRWNRECGTSLTREDADRMSSAASKLRPVSPARSGSRQPFSDALKPPAGRASCGVTGK